MTQLEQDALREKDPYFMLKMYTHPLGEPAYYLPCVDDSTGEVTWWLATYLASGQNTIVV